MCYLVSCPYIPPHPWEIDFPHLIIRYKAVEHHKNVSKLPVQYNPTEKFHLVPASPANHVLPGVSREFSFHPGSQSFFTRLFTKVDLISPYLVNPLLSPLLNNFFLPPNSFFRSILEKFASIDKRARLPPFSSSSLSSLVKSRKKLEVKKKTQRKVVLYGTCIASYNKPNIALSAINVLERSGVEVVLSYDGCCGMPQFESGDLKSVTEAAVKISSALAKYVEKGYDVVSVVASCSLMMKKEWPLILPENQDVLAVSQKTYDISEYFVELASKKELDLEFDKDFAAKISLHFACHARAQAIGFKAQEMLQIVNSNTNNLKVAPVIKCSGHGGIWGAKVHNFDKALKVGKSAINSTFTHQKDSAANGLPHMIVSDCPLAADHIAQGVEIKSEGKVNSANYHPIEVVAFAYGVHPSQN